MRSGPVDFIGGEELVRFQLVARPGANVTRTQDYIVSAHQQRPRQVDDVPVAICPLQETHGDMGLLRCG